MTASNEHNNAPAVQVYQLAKLGGPTETAWIDVTQEDYEDAGFYKDDFKRRILSATPAPAPAPAQEFNRSVADAEIKALYVESQGSDKGWLGIEGSYFIGGVVAARKRRAAPAPAQERCSTCGYLTSEREHLGCLRRAVKDLDIATGGPYDAQGVGLTDETQTQDELHALRLVSNRIKQAVTNYHHALDTRQHGGVAANNLTYSIQEIMGMPWIQGATLQAVGETRGG